MKRLLPVALGVAVLVALATALPAAAYDAHPTASATMSCSDNTATMTRTVVITVTWKKLDVNMFDAQAWTPSPQYLLASGSTTFPPESSGTLSLTLSFSDSASFDNVQWQLYPAGYGGDLAPVAAGPLDAANFPGCS